MIQTTIILAAALLSISANLSPAANSEVKASASGGDFFRFTNVWTIHLTFTPEQWATMEPKQGARPQFRPGRGGSFLQGPEGGRNGIAAAFGIVYNYVHADLELGTNVFKDVGVRYKGNGTFLSSRDSLKRSLKIDLKQFVKGQHFAGMSQINLHNSVRDPSFMNEAIAYRIFRDGEVPAPRTAYAKLYITVPGKHDRQYFGLYDLVEDVGSAFVEEWFKTSKGALLKPVTGNLFSDLGDDWKSYNQTYDPKGELSAEQKQRIIEFCKFASSADDALFATKIAEYLELDNCARYLAATVWLSDLDGILGPGQNYYLYLHPKTQKLSFIPWDQDQAFGQFPRGTEEARENLSIQRPWSGENRFLARVFMVDAFKKAYLQRLNEFSNGIFQPERIHKQVDELANILRAPLQEESPENLAEMNKAASGQKVSISMGPGFSGPILTRPIKPFVEARSKSVKDQLAGKSEGQAINPGFGRPR